MAEYILFLGQECNFQTRSILVPAKEFLQVRGDDYDILKKHSFPHNFEEDGNTYPIQNLIIQNFSPMEASSNCFSLDQTEYSSICSNMTHYADMGDEQGFSKLGDDLWLKDSITNICGGFNHFKNYDYCMKLTKVKEKEINIIDGFLFLASHDGKIDFCPFDTVEEMLNEIYPTN